MLWLIIKKKKKKKILLGPYVSTVANEKADATATTKEAAMNGNNIALARIIPHTNMERQIEAATRGWQKKKVII